MTAVELEFKSFLEELTNMLETTLWPSREQPEMIPDKVCRLIVFVEKKLRELS